MVVVVMGGGAGAGAGAGRLCEESVERKRWDVAVLQQNYKAALKNIRPLALTKSLQKRLLRRPLRILEPLFGIA